MIPRNHLRLDRRRFLGATGLAAATWSATQWVRAEDRPPVTHPRATDGDTAHEPNWDERLSLTVGPKKADLVGTNEKVIQAAVDSVARWGGGTVRILPGEYRLRNAVYLRSGVRLVGSGDDSVLIKEPSIMTTLAADSDWYDQEITLSDANGFQVGDGVCLRAKNPHDGGPTVIKRTLVARSGNRFKLDRGLRENVWLMGEPTVATLFPILSGEKITDVAIENLVLDGNRKNNANLDGNYAGCIFMQDCARVKIHGVTARNYNGDGLSWQICHDVEVENCHSHDNAGLGLHPGSGSQRPLIRNNRIERNSMGLFFCWGVKCGLAEKNRLEGNDVGISIGHRDTDNVIVDNEVLASRQVGVLFRPERGRNFAPHRNRLERNKIVDSGPADGVAVDVQGEVESIRIAANEIRETREPMQRIGVRIASTAKKIELADNRIDGFSRAVVDERAG